MRVLHLFSNFKWTGPAEPALNLCASLRRAGVEADFACPKGPPGAPPTMIEAALSLGIEPITRFRLPKHFNPLVNAMESRTLKRFLDTYNYDIIHCHLDNDHRIALSPAKHKGLPIVRTNYGGLGMVQPKRQKALVKRTRFLIEPSLRALNHDRETYGFPLGSMKVVHGAIDVHRFDPSRDVFDARDYLGIPEDAFVIGIVARLQRHRRYEDFFAVVKRMVEAGKNVHAVVVGRGTYLESVGKMPVRELGLEDRVHFPGYFADDLYVGMVKAFSTKVFLVPGSDGTCRAVREAMAMGKPPVVADRGMLDEIVDHGVNGLVCDGSPEGLYEALDRLYARPDATRAMGAAARETAATRYSLEAQAGQVLEVYNEVLATQ
ncbi:MAG: glycosyl transferase [Candidatus Hydrogenedentota bacterium]